MFDALLIADKFLLFIKKMRVMNYGYIRVSSEKQTVENQRYEITEYCKRKGLIIDKWIEESVSGARHPNVRKLGKAIPYMLRNSRGLGVVHIWL